MTKIVSYFDFTARLIGVGTVVTKKSDNYIVGSILVKVIEINE